MEQAANSEFIGEVATRVTLLPVLTDNYVFVLHNSRQAVVVDPAVSKPVEAWLETHQLDLVAILHTHHHSDHIGGSPGLLQRWPCSQVIAAEADRDRIPFQTHGVGHGDVFSLLGREVRVLGVPGHTRAHLAYYLPALGAGQQEELFCGDTLFAGGCGRLFEGTAEQMHEALQRLMALPAHTRVWCAHEYTEANLRWASAYASDNGAIAARLEAVQALRRAGQPTIPSSLALEQQTNLFVRAGDGRELAALRAHKDGWHG
jgi:hydroxyacylglutathione hydrolase